MIQHSVGNSRKSVNSIYIWEAIEPDFLANETGIKGKKKGS